MFPFCSQRRNDMGKFKDRQTREQENAALRPATIGQLAAGQIDVFCWCNRCGHHAVTASTMLAGQLGPAFPVPEIGARMRCSSCGSKDIATRPNWPSPGQVSRHG
jgi:hypothetical protein